MRAEEVAEIRKELDNPWNDLREQRVLARIQETRRRGRQGTRRPIVLASAIALAACLGALAVSAFFRTMPQRTVNVATIGNTAAQSAHEQRMALADGSQALLVRDARVQVKEQRRDLVHIAQQSGTVRYEVRPDPAREFVVFAPGATVRVRGTIFTVDVESDRVEVQVERGKVEVDDGARTRELVVGESLGIPVRSMASSADSDAAVSGEAPADSNAAAPSPVPAASGHATSFAELLQRADDARAAGREDEAAKSLQAALVSFPKDPRVPEAFFTLGKVERARMHLEDSARAFERCRHSAPSGPLAQDAVAEAALSWASAGANDASRADARQYLERWPSGIQATQMRAILER